MKSNNDEGEIKFNELQEKGLKCVHLNIISLKKNIDAQIEIYFDKKLYWCLCDIHASLVFK